MTRFIDKDEIKTGLLKHIDAFIDAEFAGKVTKHNTTEIRVGKQGSLTINREGWWYSHEEGHGGCDLFGLIMWHRDCNFREALGAANDFLAGCSTPSQTSAKPVDYEQKRKEALIYALKHWKQADEIDGTLAEDYLLRIRKIKSIPEYAHRKLRFALNIKHTPTGKYYPALIAKVQKPDGRFGGIFRIYLDPNGKGKIRDSPKMRLGTGEGAAIRLSPIAEKIIICEGLEDALTILCACPHESVWCGIGGNMRSVIFPPEVKRIIIAADNDPAGEQLAKELAHRLVRENRKVSICKPTETKDFNDILKGERP